MSLKDCFEFIWNADFEGFWLWILFIFCLIFVALYELENPDHSIIKSFIETLKIIVI
jgi:hypothetical protein